jgi:hypothetical protein
MQLFRPFLRRIWAALLLCFAPRLAPAAEPAANPFVVTTFECAGIYWKNAGPGSCTVRYRPHGASEWRPGLPLVFDARDAEYRGSLVGLSPDTEHEAELVAGGQTLRLSFRTRSDRFPVGRTTLIPAGETSRPVVIRESGKPDAYHLVTVAPGARATIDLRGSAANGVEIQADYVIIRGLEVRNAAQNAIQIQPNRHDVVVEDCHLINWGRAGGPSSFGGNAGNTDSGINAGRGTRNLTLQRNLIEHPRGASNDWDSGHPSGPQGISVFQSLGGHVIRYNEIWSTEDHGFNDAIGGGPNFSDTGNLNCDSDVYGNIIRNVWDDGIEAEGANRNVRIWGNYLHDFHVGIATAATFKGPLYIFRNVTGPSRRTHADPVGGSMIKTGDRDFGGGRRLVFHNTALQPGGVQHIFNSATPNCISRNNIFDCTGRLVPVAAADAIPSDFDRDLFTGMDRGDAREQHGIVGARLRPAYVRAYALEFFPASTVMQVKGGKVPVAFGDEERIVTDPVLQQPNPVIDAGEVLPGFNDDYTGRAPDLGAFETGRPPLQFGRRAYLRFDEGWAPWERNPAIAPATAGHL